MLVPQLYIPLQINIASYHRKRGFSPSLYLAQKAGMSQLEHELAAFAYTVCAHNKHNTYE